VASLLKGSIRSTGRRALLALDCWEWDGSVTVDEDDAAG